MRDSKQQHKLLKVTRNTTNRDKHINEASKQAFANNLSNYHVNTARYAFQMEDLFQCLQYTNLG